MTKLICPFCNKVMVEVSKEDYKLEYIQCPFCRGIFKTEDCKEK